MGKLKPEGREEPARPQSTALGDFEARGGWYAIDVADGFTRELVSDLDGLLKVVIASLTSVAGEDDDSIFNRREDALTLVRRILTRDLARTRE